MASGGSTSSSSSSGSRAGAAGESTSGPSSVLQRWVQAARADGGGSHKERGEVGNVTAAAAGGVTLTGAAKAAASCRGGGNRIGGIGLEAGDITATVATTTTTTSRSSTTTTNTAVERATAVGVGVKEAAVCDQRQERRRKSLLSAQLSELQESLPAVFRVCEGAKEGGRRGGGGTRLLTTGFDDNTWEDTGSSSRRRKIEGEDEEGNVENVWARGVQQRKQSSSSIRKRESSEEGEAGDRHADKNNSSSSRNNCNRREKETKAHGIEGDGEVEECHEHPTTGDEQSSIPDEEQLLAAEERERQQAQNYKAIFIPLDPVLSREINCEILNTDIRKYPWKRTRFGDVYYSPRYNDDRYTYRHVILSRGVRKEAEKLAAGMPGNLLTEDMFMHCLGITLSPGWSHFMIFNRKLKELILRRPKEEPPSSATATDNDRFKIDGAPGEGDEVDVESDDDDDYEPAAAARSTCRDEDASGVRTSPNRNNSQGQENMHKELAAPTAERATAAGEVRITVSAPKAYAIAEADEGVAAKEEDEDEEVTEVEDSETYSMSQRAAGDAGGRGPSRSRSLEEKEEEQQQQHSGRVDCSLYEQQGSQVEPHEILYDDQPLQEEEKEEEEEKEDEEHQKEHRVFSRRQRLSRTQQIKQSYQDVHAEEEGEEENEEEHELPEKKRLLLRRVTGASAPTTAAITTAAVAQADEVHLWKEDGRRKQSALLHSHHLQPHPHHAQCEAAGATMRGTSTQTNCTQKAPPSRREQAVFLPLSQIQPTCSKLQESHVDQEQTSLPTAYAPPLHRPSSASQVAAANLVPFRRRSGGVSDITSTAVTAADPIRRAHQRRLYQSVLMHQAADSAPPPRRDVSMVVDSAAFAGSTVAAGAIAPRRRPTRSDTGVGRGVLSSCSDRQQQEGGEEDDDEEVKKQQQQQQRQQSALPGGRKQRQSQPQVGGAPQPTSVAQKHFAAEWRFPVLRSRATLPTEAAAPALGEEEDQQQHEHHKEEDNDTFAEETQGDSRSSLTMIGCPAAALARRRCVSEADAGAAHGGTAATAPRRMGREGAAEGTGAAARKSAPAARGRSTAAIARKDTADQEHSKRGTSEAICVDAMEDSQSRSAASVSFPEAPARSTCCSHYEEDAAPGCTTDPDSAAAAVRTRSSDVPSRHQEGNRSNRDTSHNRQFKPMLGWEDDARALSVHQQQQEEEQEEEDQEQQYAYRSAAAAPTASTRGDAAVASCAAAHTEGGGRGNNRRKSEQCYPGAQQPPLSPSEAATTHTQLRRRVTRHQQQQQQETQRRQNQQQQHSIHQQKQKNPTTGAPMRLGGTGSCNTARTRHAEAEMHAPGSADLTSAAAAGRVTGRPSTRKRCSVALSWEGEGEWTATDGRGCCSNTSSNRSCSEVYSISSNRCSMTLRHRSGSGDGSQGCTTRCLRSSRKDVYNVLSRSNSGKKRKNNGDNEDHLDADDLDLSVESSSLRGKQRRSKTAAACRSRAAADAKNSEHSSCSSSCDRNSNRNGAQRVSTEIGMGCSSSRRVSKGGVSAEVLVVEDAEEECVRHTRKPIQRQKGAVTEQGTQRKEPTHQPEEQKSTVEGAGGERKVQRRRLR